MAKLTEKQQLFADEYIISLNQTEAYKKAYPNVKKDSTAAAAASRLLKNVKVSEYVNKRLEELKAERVVDQQEIMEFLSSLLRGEQTEQTLIGLGMGEQEIREIEVSAKDRIKAAELLGKRYGMWTDKQEISGNLGVVNIIDDIPDDEDG